MVRPLWRAGLASAGVALWLLVLAPRLEETLTRARAAGRVEPGVNQIASALASARRSLLPRGEDAAHLAELLRIASSEAEVVDGWTARAAVVLDPAQRLDPPAEAAPAARSRRQPWLDPELGALIDALALAHGWQSLTPPEVPPFDPWPGVEPRRRMIALRMQARTLSPEAALTVEVLAVDAAVAASRRARAESELRAALSPELLAIAAQVPGDPDHVNSAITALLARAH